MAAYRDSIYDPLNDAGCSAATLLRFGALRSAVQAAVRGGQTPEVLLGHAAGIAVSWSSDGDTYGEWVNEPLESAAVDFLAAEVEDGVPVVEAVGFLLGCVVDCACTVSLDLRFEPR